MDISNYNPSHEFIAGIRSVNLIVGLFALLVLLWFLARPRWYRWNIPTRLGFMALFFLCLAGTYGTFEVQYLDTLFRVPMVTVALIWAIVAALWPQNKTDIWSRKK